MTPEQLHDRLMARVAEINTAQAERARQLTAKDELIAALQSSADKLRQIRELVLGNKLYTLTGLKALIDGIKALVEEGIDGQ